MMLVSVTPPSPLQPAVGQTWLGTSLVEDTTELCSVDLAPFTYDCANSHGCHTAKCRARIQDPD